MNADIVSALKTVIDPELGINIVDLGLVYVAERDETGIHVALTMTSPACPLGAMMVEEIKGILESCFPEVSLTQVDLVWDPPWSPQRMTEASRRQLGMT